MVDQWPRILLRMASWSIPATVLFFFWRAILPDKSGLFFLGSATMSLYMTGALGLVPACEGRGLEERLVRTSLSAGANLLIAVFFGLVCLGIGIIYYLAGLRDPRNAALFFIVVAGMLTFFFLFFWPALASGYFLDWPTDVSSMYLAWQVWHLFPGLGRAFRVATGRGVFPKWGIAGSLCGMAHWACLSYVSGIFHADDVFPSLPLCMVVLLFVFPALSAALLVLSYRAFSRILPQYILHPQAPPPPSTPQDVAEAIAREIEEKEQRRARPILVAYQNRLGVELYPTDAEKPVALFEGDSRTSVGIRLSAAEALGYRWIDHLNNAGAEWFIPILQDLAQNEPLDDQLVKRVKREASRRLKRSVL